jgi:hypothetical protein
VEGVQTPALGPARFLVEVVHLDEQAARMGEANKAGVKSVPAIAIDGRRST